MSEQELTEEIKRVSAAFRSLPDSHCPTDVFGAIRTEEEKARLREMLEKYIEERDQEVQS